jgi:hypothetical protein
MIVVSSHCGVVVLAQLQATLIEKAATRQLNLWPQSGHENAFGP